MFYSRFFLFVMMYWFKVNINVVFDCEIILSKYKNMFLENI